MFKVFNRSRKGRTSQPLQQIRRDSGDRSGSSSIDSVSSDISSKSDYDNDIDAKEDHGSSSPRHYDYSHEESNHSFSCGANQEQVDFISEDVSHSARSSSARGMPSSTRVGMPSPIGTGKDHITLVVDGLINALSRHHTLGTSSNLLSPDLSTRDSNYLNTSPMSGLANVNQPHNSNILHGGSRVRKHLNNNNNNNVGDDIEEGSEDHDESNSKPPLDENDISNRQSDYDNHYDETNSNDHSQSSNKDSTSNHFRLRQVSISESSYTRYDTCNRSCESMSIFHSFWNQTCRIFRKQKPKKPTTVHNNNTNHNNYNTSNSSSRNNHRSNNKSSNHAKVYAKKETEQVKVMRITVWVTCFILGVSASLAAFYTLDHKASKDANRLFEIAAHHIEKHSIEKFERLMQSTQSLSQSITSAARFTKQTFPYVSVKSFELFAYEARTKGNVDAIFYAPLVPVTEYEEWINFSESMQNWPMESNTIHNALVVKHVNSSDVCFSSSQQSKSSSKLLLDNNNNNTSSVVYQYEPYGHNMTLHTWKPKNKKQQSEIFAPTLYISPPPFFTRVCDLSNISNDNNNDDLQKLPYMNINLYTDPKRQKLGTATIEENGAVFSELGIETYKSIATILGPQEQPEQQQNNGANPNETNCILSVPVYKQLKPMLSLTSVSAHHETPEPENGFEFQSKGEDIVGLIFAVFSWHSYMLDLLHHMASSNTLEGIVIVLESSCNAAMTYEIRSNGIASWIGIGDLHDSKYNHYGHTIHIFHTTTDRVNVTGHCLYHLSVYPSDNFFSSRWPLALPQKNKVFLPPIIASTMVAAIFITLSFLFYKYEQIVQSRNTKVGGAAARSNALVSSLFPSTVRDRLLAEQEIEAQSSPLAQRNAANADSQYERFMPTLRTFLTGNYNGDSNHQPIANGPALDGAASLRSSDGPSTHVRHSRSVTSKHYEHNDDLPLLNEIYKSKPIADLFPETTILFGDIVGFTAWSSVREPSQVFTLLETVYHAFDNIARRRRVFKVETVGDCYVAVCGLPDPRKDHAVTMCRFARDCMFRMWALVKKLETLLGPDTSDLTMRMGLHSGPVTAGVLRGERSRFQLFGDSVNTAARMEHHGQRSKIQLSSETANILIEFGKASWVTLREDKIVAKGKGEMQTYWLELGPRALETKGPDDITSPLCSTLAPPESPVQFASSKSTSNQNDSPHSTGIAGHESHDKVLRLVGWNVEVLLRLLRQIVARRQASCSRKSIARSFSAVYQHPENTLTKMTKGTINAATALLGVENSYENSVSKIVTFNEGRSSKMVLEEVREIIELPQFDANAAMNRQDIELVELDPKVPQQLEDFLIAIGNAYRDNPFHNFEHASHVTMSVVKLLSRIVAPSDHYKSGDPDRNDASSLHDHTYGITSDPLTQFSCVLSALIHDLDHPGVPNAQLVKEATPLALHYGNKSIAEQNSVDIAWRLLMQPKYNELRATIYQTECEMKRFRQLVVNSVMATDIVDKELKALRNARWEKAFSQEESNKLENERDQINRKATIVIEHLIQASDVAHTMQHWHIYRRWNERFFFECYKAYKMGRADTDPSLNWYQGEIGFFDFYIIPLAKKLKNCGVFGVSSDEYLNYAMKNRKEWEDRGQEIVNDMIDKVNILWNNEKL